MPSSTLTTSTFLPKSNLTEKDHGLNIYIRRLPTQINASLLRTRLLPFVQMAGIQSNEFQLHKPRAKGYATMYVVDSQKGDRFLLNMKRFPTNLGLTRHANQKIEFERNDVQDGGVMVMDRNFIEKVEQDAYLKTSMADMKALNLDTKSQVSSYQPRQKTFSINTVNCGNWHYDSKGSPAYVSEYSTPRLGKLLIGHRSIVVVLNTPYTGDWMHRIDFDWDCIDIIYTQQGRLPSLMITCKWAPRMYRNTELRQVGIARRLSMNRFARKKSRIPCLDTTHSQVVGSCFTWEFVFEPAQSLHPIRGLVEHIPDGPTSMRVSVKSMHATQPLNETMRSLNLHLTDLQLPFSINFQAMKLALSGHLPPKTVEHFTPILLKALQNGKSEYHCAEALRKFDRDLPWPGPQTPSKDLDKKAMNKTLQDIIDGDLEDSSTFRAVKRNDTLAMIHHMQITPTGLYLEGPEPEVTNRVLRKYEDHIDSFVRVTFCDEDGQQLKFQFDCSNDEIYDKFQAVLDDSIPLCGRTFQFLGFSQSSLRSQTAWFMAPFFTTNLGNILTPAHAIEDLGDFSHLRSPAKCAARIGQAFTDTNGFVTVQAKAELNFKDVERNGRVFSDGCGVMSADLAYEVSLKYQRLSMKEMPTVLQVRYRGAKGVLSVHPELKPGTLAIRPSMRKFETTDTDTHDLEICGMADKKRPMYLNRGLIKVLEDLGVQPGGFLQLAHETFQRLKGSTDSFFKAAKLLDDEHVGSAAGFPGLLRRMAYIGIDMRKDRILCAVVEMAAFCRLRAMKYKGRILVKDGVKLMGIMDETGVLKEGQIHVAWIDDRGRRTIHTGKVAITRSPTNHPGDVQLAMAVDVPVGSPLYDLYNCVIFSQHGDRDLPSQLGGGDLDGDLYDVIWDQRIMPPRLYMPAEYPRLPAIDIGRKVTAPDISKHFIDFMKNDNIGLLANQLLVVSDRAEKGSMDDTCIAISELMSTALDYPKTGIVADMKRLPRIEKSWKPDFMAPGPQVRIEKLQDPLSIVMSDALEATPDDPVTALDPNERKTQYYESSHILGKLYRLVDEKGFYEQLQAQTKNYHQGKSVLEEVLSYAQRATAGFDFKQYLGPAREIRSTYEEQVDDICHTYTLHQAHPLHEIEVVTGAVLGSVFVRKLRELTSDMKERFARDVAYVKERIRYDDNGSDDEGMSRAVACLYVGVREQGRKIGRLESVEMWSWAYVAAGVCLEEIERSNGGKLPLFGWRIGTAELSNTSYNATKNETGRDQQDSRALLCIESVITL